MLLQSVQKSKRCIQSVETSELHRGISFISICISGRVSKDCQQSSMNSEEKKGMNTYTVQIFLFICKLSFVQLVGFLSNNYCRIDTLKIMHR